MLASPEHIFYHLIRTKAYTPLKSRVPGMTSPELTHAFHALTHCFCHQHKPGRTQESETHPCKDSTCQRGSAADFRVLFVSIKASVSSAQRSSQTPGICQNFYFRVHLYLPIRILTLVLSTSQLKSSSNDFQHNQFYVSYLT